MANEAQPLIELEPAVPVTVADGTGIERGTLLKLSDLNTGAISTAKADPLVGIARTEKIASDGVTSLGVTMRGIFKMKCSGAVPVGAPVCSYADANYPNYIGSARDVNASGAATLGHALEAGADGETIRTFVNVGAGGTFR